jgi:hypothetical protein
VNDEHGVVRALVELSDSLVDEFDVVDFLHRLCGHSVDLFDAGAAGVMLVDADHRLKVLAASSEEVELLELFQIQAEQGPCLEAHRTGAPTQADTAEELLARWPRFGERIASQFESVYAFPMRLRGDSLGALNLYGRDPHALGEGDMPLGQALADVATISLLQHRAVSDAAALSAQLQYALNSRIVIEQAKGKYAERRSVDVGTAFEALRAYSHNHNTKLVDVATAFLDDDIDIAAEPT